MKPEDFIKVLEDITREDKPNIDVTKQRHKLALHTILVVYYQSDIAKSPQMWQPMISKDSKKESEKDFFEGLMNNHQLSAILVALYRYPHNSIAEFSKAIKAKKDQNFPELLDLLTAEPTIAMHIKDWLNSEFIKLKSKAPGIYYSFLYYAAFKQDNADALTEVLQLFPDKSQLEKLRDLKGNEFREFYINSNNVHFWRNLNLITSHYYERTIILNRIAEKLLDGTDEKERAKIIQNILRSKNPFNKDLETTLMQQLSKPEQEPEVRLVSMRGGAELPFAEFEVLCPLPERAPRITEQASHISERTPHTGPSK